ncbi:OmpA family protein [bacterium]|nr:OmpA family protein [bacterium]
MKKLLLLLFFIGGLVSTQAQESMSQESINETHRALILKLGVNLVDSTGDNNPFNLFSDFDQIAFSSNYNIEAEYRFNRWVSLAASWSNNKWEANKGNIDGSIVRTDVDYSAIDLDLKYYYDDAFGGWFDRNDWLELYLHGGAGWVSQADNSGVVLNIGPGANFWITDQFGLNLNGTGRWVLKQGEELYNTNHFQYSASLMYRFMDNDDDNGDEDNDGVKNKVDDCPDVFGVAKNNGCPEEEVYDRDGDGIADSNDECPDVYGTTDVGCPKIVKEADTDGDSVLDSVDKCPKIIGLPTNNGCPLPDTDNDGIVDSADKCPNVPGVESNNGCPYEEIEIGTTEANLNIVSKGILFNSGNANFSQDSYPVLIKVVEMMKQYPEAKFKIEGHTDSSGRYDSNKLLSQTRANVVRNYLISSDIPSENLDAEGFGETRPAASNLTKEGRRLNRRVEIIRIK